MIRFVEYSVFALWAVSFCNGLADDRNKISGPTCNVSKELVDEIWSYKPIVDRITKAVMSGQFQNSTLSDLTYFVDNFGSRIAGSEALEKSIDFMLEQMDVLGFSNVHTENVTAPKWVRGEESLQMIAPWRKNIPVLGLAFSVPTPPEGITAEIALVSGFQELKEKITNASGKIIVFDQGFENPEKAIKYRQYAAIEGAKLGAAAVIVRSYATFSLSTPHTGLMFYDESVKKIPAGEISIEDAELLHRLSLRGVKVVLNLKIQGDYSEDIITRNSIGDYPGLKNPDEFVLISGHIDSFDVGQGALDDGYGVILSVKAVQVLKALKLTPKRTIRTILWTAEEIGEIPLGAKQYLTDHEEELREKYSVFLEADSGIFDAHGLIFNGTEEAACILAEILKLLEPDVIKKNTSRIYPDFPRLKTDIVPLMQGTGVPGALIASDPDKYFWYHHSHADTVTALNAKDLDICLAMWSALSYILADLSIMLPRF